MTTSSTALGRIGQIALTVHDMDRAISFWRDTVGLKFLFQAPNVAFFDVAGVRLMLGSAESPDVKPAGTVLYFEECDVRRLEQELESDRIAPERDRAIHVVNGQCDLADAAERSRGCRHRSLPVCMISRLDSRRLSDP